MNLFILLFFPFCIGNDAQQVSKIDSLIQYISKINYKSNYAIMIDMSAPSDKQRLFLINLSAKKCGILAATLKRQ
ncbi:MAG: hypothetical protein EPN85_02655 [Bacteroidetes bacterium]|nr:MAG: hypothetical protein EPN85_02655 [Bacteroidota bacterium]